MLTSPMNVAPISPAGPSIRTHASSPDAGSGNALKPGNTAVTAPPAAVDPDAAADVPDLPTSSLVTHVNAMAATAGNRTVLQDLVLKFIVLLNMQRGDKENLTALFIRIIAAIDAMPQAERLQLEMRSGLKAMRITLPELAAALRNPDGPEAARLTAVLEAPTAAPGRTAANAATSSYLQQGTANGHAEETLVMRAAARTQAAGQGLFSAEAKLRPAEPSTINAKGLQDQLKTLFEPNATDRKTGSTPSPDGGRPAGGTTQPPMTAGAGRASSDVVLRSSQIRVDAQFVERIHEAARMIAEGEEPRLAANANAARMATKADAADDRLETILTLKGMAEASTPVSGKAADLLASAAEAAPTAQTVAAEAASLKLAATPSLHPADEPVALANSETGAGDPASETMADVPGGQLAAAEDGGVEMAAVRTMQQERAGPAATTAAAADSPAQASQQGTAAAGGVPFAYATLPPAREEFALEIEDDEDAGEEDEPSEQDDEDAADEQRRPRDEYDAIKDPLPEEDPTIVITRDSSEADRAFALYQRMGGF